MVLVLSEKGYMKRVSLQEFPVKGRGSMGVLSLNVTKTTGPVVAVAGGRATRSTTVDVLAADGKRQRCSLRSIPVEHRANRGKKLLKLERPQEIVVLG
jgi:DNA gyrase subunit A